MTPTVVLCMAGRYRRFRDAGYTLPKFLLPARGEPVLAHVIAALGADRPTLVCNLADREHEEAIARIVPDADRIWVGDTSGQAETAAIGARHLIDRGVDGPVLFHNIDTVVRGRDLAKIGARLVHVDGFVDTFESDSPAFSYVTVDGRRVTGIAEKVVISSHATSGLYGFASPSAYVAAAARTQLRSGEFHVSDVYRTLIDEGARIEVDPSPVGHETVVLGTPPEYETWRG